MHGEDVRQRDHRKSALGLLSRMSRLKAADLVSNFATRKYLQCHNDALGSLS